MKPQSWFITIPPFGAAREVGLQCAAAFEQLLGKTHCKTFDCKTYLDFFSAALKNPEESVVVDLVNHVLTVQCLAQKATHCLVCALSPVTLFTLNLLRSYSVKTCHWFYEDYKKAVYWKDVLAGYDYFFAIQKGPVEAACAAAGNTYRFLPTAAGPYHQLPLLFQNQPLPKTHDVAFVGVPTPYRIGILEQFKKNGISLVIAGLGWETYRGELEPCIANSKWTDGKQVDTILKSAKIGINLSMNSPAFDIENTHISPRVFDVLAAGLALVTEKVPLLDATLSGIAYRTFSDGAEAVNAVRLALSEYDAAAEERLHNKAVIESAHTYGARAKTILETTGQP